MADRKTGLGFTTESAALAKVMRCVAGAVEQRNTIPILANVLMTAKDGRVTFTGTDLDMTIVVDLPAAEVQDGELTVSASAVAAVARELDATDIVRFEACEAGVRIASGHYAARLFALDAADFPRVKPVEGDYPYSFTIHGPRLKSILDRVFNAIGNEETRYYLHGVLIEAGDGDGDLRFVATDGHRISLVKAEGIAVSAGFPNTILPREAVKQLRKLLNRYSGDVLVRATAVPDEPEIPSGLDEPRGRNHVQAPRFIRFDLTGVSVTSKPIDGTFPDYTKVIPKDYGKMLAVRRDTLAKGLGRVAAISEENGTPIKISLAPDEVVLSASCVQNGSSRIRLNGSTRYDGSPLEIGFQARYLRDAIAHAGEDLEIHLSDAARPVTIRTAGDDSALEVVMPMRIGPEAK
jgi:DNA polymerase III subunit beta